MGRDRISFLEISPKKWGGGVPFGRYFKDGWVKYNHLLITSATNTYNLPAPLLAGVCWIEVGGDPSIVDMLAFDVRAIDWSGPEWIDEHITITSRPEETSFGAVSMQLRTAARTLGLDESKMDTSNCVNWQIASSMIFLIFNLWPDIFIN